MQMAIIEVTEEERFVRLLMIQLHGGNLNNHEKVLMWRLEYKSNVELTSVRAKSVSLMYKIINRDSGVIETSKM